MKHGRAAARAGGVRSAARVLPVTMWIARKRDGGELDDESIADFIAAAARGLVPDYQIAALLMAIVWRGLSPRELVSWTRAMIASGDTLHLEAVPGMKVDKHSTGGVGDKVSLCLAPLVAACGVPVPMLAGRALGHTGGTLDKLQAIRGYRVDVPPALFRRILDRVGFVIAGQTRRLVPADRILYALRDATATVESIPLIASSILSKKVAGGADALVMDVKVGAGAFLPSPYRTRALARAIVALGARLGLRTVAVLTDVDEPLGDEIGNAREVAEAIAILRGEGPADTRAVTLRLGAEMLRLAGVARTRTEGERRLREAITSGRGLERFMAGVAAMGGDVRLVEHPERLPRASRQLLVRAPRAGCLQAIDARAVGTAATLLGAGRLRKEDRIEPGVGITLHARGGDRIARGQPLCTVWYNSGARLAAAHPHIEAAFRVARTAPPARTLFKGYIAQ